MVCLVATYDFYKVLSYLGMCCTFSKKYDYPSKDDDSSKDSDEDSDKEEEEEEEAEEEWTHLRPGCGRR